MKVLVFAPHNDDEVLGVGGTIAKYTQSGNQVIVCEVTSGSNENIVKKIKKEALQAHKLLGVTETVFLDLPVVNLKNLEVDKLNASFLEIVQKVKPDVAFIPHKGDMHIDHYEVAMAAMVALRPVNNPQLKARSMLMKHFQKQNGVYQMQKMLLCQMFGMILQIHLQARWRQ